MEALGWIAVIVSVVLIAAYIIYRVTTKGKKKPVKNMLSTSKKRSGVNDKYYVAGGIEEIRDVLAECRKNGGLVANSPRVIVLQAEVENLGLSQKDLDCTDAEWWIITSQKG